MGYAMECQRAQIQIAARCRVLDQKAQIKLSLEYENTLENRDAIYQDLDNQFGRDGYRVTRVGPQHNSELGLMVVEITQH